MSAEASSAEPSEITLTGLDTFDPQRLADRRWDAAVHHWLAGNLEPLHTLLSDPAAAIPDHGRLFLADLAIGKVKRSRGRPAEYPPWVERSMVAEVFAEHERCLAEPRQKSGKPQERAIAAVAAKRGMTEPSLRGFVEKLRRVGWTLERWQSWGRPNFKQPNR